MKNTIIHTLTLAALLSSPGRAQTSPLITITPPAVTDTTFVRGTMDISFDATSADKPVVGVTDKYNINVNVSNAAKFRGLIERLPNIKSTLGFGGQAGSLNYALAVDLINPKNPKQVIEDLGTLSGTVPNDKQNVYRFEDGDLTMTINAHGNAAGFQNKFGGLALGKPPAGSASLKMQALSFIRNIKGNAVRMKVTKYDTMEFREHVLASGPTLAYSATKVNGTMVFDYERNVWHFKDVTCSYSVNGTGQMDTLSGDIQWKPNADRKTSGKGSYVFDIRVNEPPPSEDAAFTATAATDEAAFFATDENVKGLSGTMDYIDTIKDGTITPDNEDGTVTSSAVRIDLKGNQLSKQEVMFLAKLILFSCVVPMNSD